MPEILERKRVRELGITVGELPTGSHNAITDVAGVLVGHCTVMIDQPRIARTGVTVVVPRDGDIWDNYAFAGIYSLNGAGEMTGSHWIEEAGTLPTPIGITNTHQVGVVRDGLIEWAAENKRLRTWTLPVVAETYDGRLSDIDAFHVTKEHVFQAMAAATGGTVSEGNVGGGTGMCCHGFKGGIGTSSRVVEAGGQDCTVGVIVQANYGVRRHLCVDGIPVGREMEKRRNGAKPISNGDGSIIVIVATDAPLVPIQCQRIAQRATIGVGRVGGRGHNGSGDIFLAFSTGNNVPADRTQPYDLRMLPNREMNVLFDATVEAVEESILNALTMAETMSGVGGNTVEAIPLDELVEIMNTYSR